LSLVSINGIKTHQTVSDALSIVENLEHRAGKDAEGKTGDGVGKFRSVKTRLFDFIFHKSNHPFVYSKALLAHNILLF